MKIPLTYAEARQRHPKLVAAAIRALRSSQSKNNKAAPSSLSWDYDIAVRVEGFSMREVLSGEAAKRAAERERLPMEDRIQERLDNSYITLRASVGQWRHSSEQITLPPKEWVAYVRNDFKRAQEERDAYEALPEKEKEARLKDALRAAKKSPGFVHLSLKKSRD